MTDPLCTDLVTRLRGWADRARIPLIRSALVIEAADEIERLRKRVNDLEEVVHAEIDAHEERATR